MKIKTKLTLGVGLLFVLIVVLAAIGVQQINKLSNDSRKILEDNYLSLEYSRQMLNEIGNLSSDPKAAVNFKIYLKKQQNNPHGIRRKRSHRKPFQTFLSVIIRS